MADAERSLGRCLVASLDHGSDLLAEIERIATEHDVCFADVRGIGSLERAVVTFYDQATKEDKELVFERPLMLLAMAGSVIGGKDGGAHVHLILADDSGRVVGGDLSPGCRVYSAELMLTELTGAPASREVDQETGLARLRFG